jgi:hypothetical protein
MDRFLYEYSSCHRQHLIIPYACAPIAGHCIFSYRLLSEQGHRGRFHKAENPAELYADTFQETIEIAKEHLDRYCEIDVQDNYFKNRYIYKNTLIIVVQHHQKYFYDHYPATELINIAAPKIFCTETDCIHWIKRGLDRNYSGAIADS